MVLFVDGHVAGPFLCWADFAWGWDDPDKPVFADPTGDDDAYN
ncbi:unnamed protein product [marine sediment metagenome]|uniref:Uncharacterized protein n=1 Tax=marine sediment metagenome TaxID=412755 RepID=X0U4Z5_9ZZZZ